MLVVPLTQGQGESAVHETMFDDRLAYLDELTLMGATVQPFDECLDSGRCPFSSRHHHSVLIAGPSELHGEELRMRDIRAGFGLVIGAMMVKGQQSGRSAAR